MPEIVTRAADSSLIVIEAAPELAIAADTFLGETPVWSVDEQALYWINCENPPRISRWREATGERGDWPMPERVGGFVQKEGGGLLVVLSSGVFDFQPETGKLEERARSPLPPYAALHECHCDRDGRFWVGAIDHRLREMPEPPGGGKLLRLDGDRLVAEADGISCANGLAFSPDGSHLYLADSPLRQIDRWSLDPASGRLADRRPFVTIEEGAGFPDGATVDSQGRYWITLVYSGALRCYEASGALAVKMRLPFSNPTKVAFGGADMKTLFITTTKLRARTGEANRGAELLGGLYSLRLDVPGIADAKFRD